MSAKTRDAYLRRAYGITLEEYEYLASLNEGCCWICGAPPKSRPLHVDHDHKTGRVRGLLCWACNRALPYNLTPDLLDSMADYLRYTDASQALLTYRAEKEYDAEV